MLNSESRRGQKVNWRFLFLPFVEWFGVHVVRSGGWKTALDVPPSLVNGAHVVVGERRVSL